jgi:hypothetical protein
MASASATAERTGTGRNGTDIAYQETREEARQQEREDRARLRGEWHRIDPTDNTMEWCRTVDRDVIMLRCSYDHRRNLPVTRGQVRHFVQDADTDPELRDLLRL